MKRHDGRCDVRRCTELAAEVRTFTVTGVAVRLFRVCGPHAKAIDGNTATIIFRQRRGVLVTADGRTLTTPPVRR